MATKLNIPIVVNTNSFREEDLTTFLECSERIKRCEKRQSRRSREAIKTHEEIFEGSMILENEVSQCNDNVSFYSHTASMEDLMKYFGEDVEVDSDPQQDINNRQDFTEKLPKAKQIKQSPLKRNEETKKLIAENIIKNKFIEIEPNTFKPTDGNACIKPSDLKAKQSKKIDIPEQKPINKMDPNRKYVKLADLGINSKKHIPEVLKSTTLIPEPKKNGVNQMKVVITENQQDAVSFAARPEEVLKPSDGKLKIRQQCRENINIKMPVEQQSCEQQNDFQSKWEKTIKNKKPKKSKVQKITEMFNGIISQVMNKDSIVSTYQRLNNETSPDPAKPPQPRARTKIPIQRKNSFSRASPRPSPRPTPRPSPRLDKRNTQESGCLIPEEVFAKLSVKDKALLFSKFMKEMSLRNPELSINPNEFKALEKKFDEKKTMQEVTTLVEKQETVKSLAKDIEAKIVFPKQIISDAALSKKPKIRSKKGPAPQPPTSGVKKENPIHISSLTVVLKPSPKKIDSEPKMKPATPVLRRKITNPTVIVCPSLKRTFNHLGSSILFEVYAPPKKIPRTRPERCNSKKYLKSSNLERLFYDWMKAENGVSFNIHPREHNEPKIQAKPEDNEKTNETDTTLKNEEKDSDKENVEPEQSSNPVCKNEQTESDSSLLTMPNSNMATDESQTDQAKESTADFEFLKPIRPLRRKKFKRATLTWKNDASIIERLPVSPPVSTDSDSDANKQAAAQLQNQKPKKTTIAATDQSKGKMRDFKTPSPVTTPTDQNSFEVNKAYFDSMNSPRRIRNAYTLTVMTSPAPSQTTESTNSQCYDAPPKPPRRRKSSSNPQLPYEIDESKFEHEDQGFETGSNGFSPIRLIKKSTTSISQTFENSFIKINEDQERRMSSVSQTPSAYSTPVKDNLISSQGKTTPVKTSSWHTIFSPIQAFTNRRRSITDSESRRSSIVMDVIREEQQNQTKKIESDELEDEVFHPSTPKINKSHDKSSSFWISFGGLTVSIDVFYYSPDLLNQLQNKFNEESREIRQVHFGIDNFRYSPQKVAIKQEITPKLEKVDGISYYWFSSGDQCVPFRGNFMTPEKIKQIFVFIHDSSADSSQLSFGLDDFEFSKIPDPAINAPKFSIESSYSLLIGLNGQSSHQRSKHSWPNTSQNPTPQKTSDFDPSEFDSDGFEASEIGRLSFSPYGNNYFDMVSMQSGERTSSASVSSTGSPELFSFEYENEPLDKMFGTKKAGNTFTVSGRPQKVLHMPKPLPPTDSMTIDHMIETIRKQQKKLQNLKTDMNTYTSPKKFTSSILDKYHGKSYVKKLNEIVKSIQDIGKSGFQNCSAQQLENFLHYLTLYAETRLSTCNDNMSATVEKLKDEKAVQPPENELQKSHDNTTRLSEHQLRVQASLQRLNIPDWFRQYNLNSPKSPDVLGNKTGNINFTRKRASDSGRWTGLNSKTTSLSSLGSQRSDRSPLLLSPSAHSHHGGQTTIGSVVSSSGGTNVSGGFSRWSTSYLNSTQTSPSVSTRGSFSRGGPVNSSFISATSSASGTRSSFRQPYLGWRSQEKLSQPRTPHERLASSLLAQRTPKPEQPVTPEIQTSIKEVTSAIVHYVNDQTNRTNQRSRSASPNSRKCWLESSFVGVRPVESPQTPIIDNSTFSNTSTGGLNHSFHNNTTSATSSIHSSIGINNVTTADSLRLNGVGAPERTMSSASLEDVLASLLGLPPTQVPATNDTYRSTADTASEAVNPRMTSSTSPCSLQVVDQQARFRRRSEGDAQRQKEQQLKQQQQQILQSQNHQISITNKPVAANNNVNSESNQTPRRVSLDSSESKTTSELQIKCRNTKCDQAATPVDAKKFYKSCHNCSHLYCSRECRRTHWEKHRKACLHSRASNLCRQVLSSCKDDVDTLRHLSLLARKGYLSQGRGVVRVLFRSAESAEGFIKHGFQCMGEASYVRWPDLMPAEMGLELYSELLKLSTEYKPDSKMLIYVAICVVSEAPGTATAPVKWERQLVSRCAKLKLCKSILTELEQSQQQIVVVPEPATEILILTFNPAKRSTPSQREVILTNILTILNRRGVVLRKHYPEIYQRLQTYAEGQTDRFNAVTLHPRDSQTGQGFVCIIMPLQSDSEIIKMPCSDGGNKVSTIDVGEELMES